MFLKAAEEHGDLVYINLSQALSFRQLQRDRSLTEIGMVDGRYFWVRVDTDGLARALARNLSTPLIEGKDPRESEG